MKFYAAIFLFISTLVSSSSQALRCENKIVSEKMSAAEVEHLCGTPIQVNSRTLYHIKSATTGETYISEMPPENFDDETSEKNSVKKFSQVTDTLIRTESVEVWHYNFGPSKLMIELIFSDGKLIEEKTLGYGY